MKIVKFLKTVGTLSTTYILGEQINRPIDLWHFLHFFLQLHTFSFYCGRYVEKVTGTLAVIIDELPQILMNFKWLHVDTSTIEGSKTQTADFTRLKNNN